MVVKKYHIIGGIKYNWTLDSFHEITNDLIMGSIVKTRSDTIIKVQCYFIVQAYVISLNLIIYRCGVCVESKVFCIEYLLVCHLCRSDIMFQVQFAFGCQFVFALAPEM